MREIITRAYREPAVAIGLLTSIALAVITVATGDPFDTAAIAGIAAPLLASLGIRELVTPATPPPHSEPPPEPSVEAQQIKEFDS